MFFRFATILALIALSTPAWAQEQKCWVSYDDFERMVPHTDLVVCPGSEITVDKGFCRLGLESDTVTIYVFMYGEDDNICLEEGRGYDITSFIQRFGDRHDLPK